METDAHIVREFDECIFPNKLGMIVLGIWPLDRNNSWLRILGWKIQMGIVYSSMNFFFCIQLFELYFAWEGSGSQVSLSNTLSTFAVMVKLCSFVRHMDTFREILQTMRKNWLRVMREATLYNRDLMYRTMMRAHSWSNKYFLLTTVVAMLSIPLPFVRGSSFGDLENPFFGRCCTVHYFSQILAGTTIGLANCVTDTMFLLCTYYLSAQLQILQNDLMDFGYDGHHDGYSHLISLIKRHQDEITNAQALQSMFGQSSLQQILLSCLMICMNGFKLIVSSSSPDADVVMYLMSLTFTLLQMLCYCQPGNELIVQSQSLDEAIYQSAWMNMNKSSVKDLTFMMQRSQKPLSVRAGKVCVLSLQNFMRVVKTSISVLSVLLAIYRKEN